MSLLDSYSLVTEILIVIGIWRILRKCGKSGWYSLIPGFRYYQLGICGGKETDGLSCLFLEILTRLLAFSVDVVPTGAGIWKKLILPMLLYAAIITMVVFEIRVILGLLRTFDMKRRWIILWILAPFIPALMMGFVKSYQPVNLGKYGDEHGKGGLKPADLSAPVDNDQRNDGLVIRIRDRRVRELARVRYLLKDINLTIPNGSMVLLLGGSGAGKTTLVNAIIGYEKANADICLNGVDVYKHYDKMKYRIGFVPQQDLLRMNDTVIRTLGDAATLRLPVQVKEEEKKERIQNVMEVLGLTVGAEGLISKKSGGQKKRISIGMELISSPDLFMLDEPDSGLDGVIARELFEKLRMVADEGKIVMAITHTPDRVIDLFDKVIVLAKDSGKVGRLAFYGSPAEAEAFFERDGMEKILMAINAKDEGGEGRADEFIEKFAKMTAEKGAGANE